MPGIPRRPRRARVDAVSRTALDQLSPVLLGARAVLGKAETRQHHQRHEEDAHDGATREHPAQAFHLGLGVAVEHHGDLVVELLDLRGSVGATSSKGTVGDAKTDLGRDVSLLAANTHLAIVKHALEVILERQDFLVHLLGEDIRLVLEMRALPSHLFVLRPPIILHFRLELRAGGAKEIGFLHDAFVSRPSSTAYPVYPHFRHHSCSPIPPGQHRGSVPAGHARPS